MNSSSAEGREVDGSFLPVAFLENVQINCINFMEVNPALTVDKFWCNMFYKT